jgi:hypothetical protein
MGWEKRMGKLDWPGFPELCYPLAEMSVFPLTLIELAWFQDGHEQDSHVQYHLFLFFGHQDVAWSCYPELCYPFEGMPVFPIAVVAFAWFQFELAHEQESQI